jgi:hypothetical protein
MKPLFYTAAAFNMVMSFLFAFFHVETFAFFSIVPVPAHPMMTQLFAVLVLAFGIGYFWIARDPVKNRQIILLGALAKIMLVLFVGFQVITGIASWQLLIPVSADLIYAVLFVLAYRTLPAAV